MSYTYWDPIPDNIYVYNQAPLGVLPPGPFIQDIPWPTRIAGPQPARHPYWYLAVYHPPPYPLRWPVYVHARRRAYVHPPRRGLMPHLWDYIFMQ